MKTTVLIAFLLLATVLVPAQSFRSSDDIVIEFEDPAILSGDQIHTVKDLALRAGLPTVVRDFQDAIDPSSLAKDGADHDGKDCGDLARRLTR